MTCTCVDDVGQAITPPICVVDHRSYNYYLHLIGNLVFSTCFYPVLTVTLLHRYTSSNLQTVTLHWYTIEIFWCEILKYFEAGIVCMQLDCDRTYTFVRNTTNMLAKKFHMQSFNLGVWLKLLVLVLRYTDTGSISTCTYRSTSTCMVTIVHNTTLHRKIGTLLRHYIITQTHGYTITPLHGYTFTPLHGYRSSSNFSAF